MDTSRIIDTDMTHGASRETTAEGPEASVPDEASRREFDRLYSQERPRNMPVETREGEMADLSEQAAPDSRKTETESLPSLMSSLFGERLGAASAPTTPAVPVASADAPRMAEMVDRLVEQILVSHPDRIGNRDDREVRLMVRNSVLPDTEIRLSRGADGLLSVTLATGRSDALQTLVAARADLKQALDTQENREIRLTVLDTRDAEAEDGNSDRRSRAYTAYAPDDGGDTRPGR
jgi:type III secretion system needle length determinant